MPPLEQTVVRPALRDEAGPGTRRVPDPSIRAMVEVAPHAACRWEKAFDEMPEIGDRFLDFELIDTLGEGAFGQVFLARQGDLADRLVAVKISADLLDEPAKLARLQHAAIMPVYSTHRTNALGAVCMPFYGRATLADLCSSLRRLGTIPLSGQAFISTVKSKRRGSARPASAHPEAIIPSRLAESSHAEPAPASPPEADDAIPHPLEALARLDYVDAILLTGVRIAEGLAHAHERGIVHQDLKPANILITDEGLPMILDFNLARDLRSAVGAVRAQVGGTIPYMSPEQSAHFRDKSSTAEIDGRSDLYSLGLILAQLLTGNLPFAAPPGTPSEQLPPMLADGRGAMPSLRARNPAIGPAVESILRKCLEPDPARRYQSAQAFVEDVQRHRADLPLLHAPNPCFSERAQKWVRRHPRLASPQTALLAVAVVLLAVAGLSVRGVVAAKQKKFQALALVGRQKLSDLEENTALAEHFLASDVENAPWLADGVTKGVAALEPLGAIEDADWIDRPEFAGLLPQERDRLKGNAGYLAYLLTRASRSAKQSDRPERALDARLRALGESLKASPLMETRQKYLRAVELQAEGKYREAKQLLVEYLHDNPEDVGGNFMLGRTHALLGEFEEASRAYGVCIALKPRFAPGYFNRALLSHQQGDSSRALADLDSALRLQPGLTDALLVRSIVHLQLRKYPAALKDIQAVIDGESPPVRAWFLRAAIYDRMGEKEKAEADRLHAMKQEPTDAASLIARGNARIGIDPKAALADYEAAEKLAPLAVEPLQNQANVEAERLSRPERAVAILDRLLKRHPDYVPGLCGRAVYLARAGKIDEALAEAKRILALSDTPFTQYRVACVYALASAKKPALADEALRQMARALQHGEGHAYLDIDSDLDALKGRPAFESLLQYVKHLKSLQKPARP
jgi:serine/threonine protein kinase/predicted Zn-dependent protease